MKSEYFVQKYVIWNTPQENLGGKLFDNVYSIRIAPSISNSVYAISSDACFVDLSTSNATYHTVYLLS